jgi:transcription antitermination factor NusG
MLNLLDLKIGQFVDFVDVEKPKPIITEGVQLRWHIVITERARERPTLMRLEDIGLKPYFPVVHKQQLAGRGRKREIEEPMFLNRLLVPLPLDVEAWRRVRNVRGVEDFMFEGRKPALLHEMVIEEIRKTQGKEDAKYLRELARRAKSPYQKNRPVWAELMLQKLLGKIHGRDARGRIEVLFEVEIFGRQIWAFEPHELQLVDDWTPPAPKKKNRAK